MPYTGATGYTLCFIWTMGCTGPASQGCQALAGLVDSSVYTPTVACPYLHFWLLARPLAWLKARKTPVFDPENGPFYGRKGPPGGLF